MPWTWDDKKSEGRGCLIGERFMMMPAGRAGLANGVNWRAPHLREARLVVTRFLKGHTCSPSSPCRLRKTPRPPSPWSSNEPRTPPGTQRTHSLARTHVRTLAAPALVSPRTSFYAFAFDCRVTCFDFSLFHEFLCMIFARATKGRLLSNRR